MSQWPRRQDGDSGKWRANTRGIIAVEWLAACQGIDLREGLTSSPLLEQARQTLREQVAHYTQDRFFRARY
ncbi:histidine ammonia-lyase [Salmonella enterica subsp. enterica]|uniref:Histidine ammonia-lyase n=1 Tax=Salmonella enterica I TaxID=59201 RepID=A0A3S4M030_SALET|nr:histidine ammonia-lyase [Salmonella enterica subsp. enterica]